ncbi:MAG: helix-turn-helix domain-containing protein [Planctomycetes bacterium]|nr:helix-turn-helix domain-containing protein [Planctomycetota bacterium]
MRNKLNRTATDCWLLPAAQAAEQLNISERHLWNLHSRGHLPEPVRLGRSVRWRRDELEAWIRAGSPSRDRWELIKGSHIIEG